VYFTHWILALIDSLLALKALLKGSSCPLSGSPLYRIPLAALPAGRAPKHDVVLLDRMLVNTNQLDGKIQTYIENELVQEATYSTVSNPVESTAGEVYVNMVPKDGGNTLASSARCDSNRFKLSEIARALSCFCSPSGQPDTTVRR
jgi:hypothetical protein